MRVIGIGGAGCKIATKWDSEAVAVNVSEVELGKLSGGGEKILASLSSGVGSFQGSRMDPAIGYDAYNSVRRQLTNLVRGSFVFAATGGGTGNGIARGILEDLVERDDIPLEEKTMFGLILPYARLESGEFVTNTSNFMNHSVAPAIDAGVTGNIFMFSNRVKFEKRLSEDKFNGMIVDSLRQFFAVPQKNAELKLLDEHIDAEDFALFLSKPYFNHYTVFNFKPDQEVGSQIAKHHNPLLLAPEQTIEALFLLEVPEGGDPTAFYSVVEYFNEQSVKPLYSVVENPALKEMRLTVSMLYSRAPAELVADFNRVAEEHAQTKARRTIDQHVKLPDLQVDLGDEAKKLNPEDDDILTMLKRIKKL